MHLLVAVLQIADTVLRDDELLHQRLTIRRLHSVELRDIDIAHKRIRLEILHREPHIPVKERDERTVFLALRIRRIALAEILTLQAEPRVFRIDARRRLRAPADKESRGVRVRAGRAALDDLMPCGMTFAADHIVAHRETVEGIRLLRRIAVKKALRDHIAESHDECRILAAAEPLLVRLDPDELHVHLRAILEHHAGVLYLLRR